MLLTSKLLHLCKTLLTMKNQNKALHLLRDGFKEQFAISVFDSEKFFDLVMDLSVDFVDENIPIVDDELRHDMALLLCESIKLGNY